MEEFRLYESDDVTLAQELPVALLAADTSAAVEYHAWNDIGGALGADTKQSPYLHAEAFVGGEWVGSGTPILDEKWIQIRAIGDDKTGDPAMEDQITGWMSIGTDSDFPLGDIPRNCARHFEVRIKAPGTAQTSAPRIRIVPAYDDGSRPLARQVTAALGSGVLLGRLDVARRRFRRGADLVADGTATVVIDPRTWDADGVTRTRVRESQVLDQNDSAAAPLVAGEAYIVTVSQPLTDTAATWTKGVKGVAPTAPAKPADELLVGTVTVRFDAGGVSLIDQGDIDQSLVLRGDRRVEAAAGLNIRIWPGDGLSSIDQYQVRNSSTEIAVEDSTTNYIWDRPDGSSSATQTEVAPELGAYLLAEADTDADSVTAIRDRRTISARAVTLHAIELDLVRGPVTFLGDDLAWATVPPGDWDIEDTTPELGQLGDGTGGQIQIDVTTRDEGIGLDVAGTTIFTSFATDDHRPAIAFDAASLRTVGVNHEVRRVRGGQRIAAGVVDLVTGATVDPRDLKLMIVLRRA